MGATHIAGKEGNLISVSVQGAQVGTGRPLSSLGTLAPGGLMTIVGNTKAAASVVTTLLPHGLTSGDSVNIANANSTTSINGVRVVTVITTKTFSVPVDTSGGASAGTAGTIQPVILSSTAANPTVVTAGSVHGLRTGDTVTVTGSAGGTSLDGAAQVVTVTGARTFSIPIDVSAGTTSTALFTKVTYYSDVLDRGGAFGGGALVVTSTIGTAPTTVTCNIEGSVDGTNWFNVPYALVATPRTFVVTALGAIVSAVATTYLLQELVYWRYLRLKCASATNVALALTATFIE